MFDVQILQNTRSLNRTLTTFQLTYPRFIHSELMAHRVFSRSASSSRAVPIEKVIQRLLDGGHAEPVFWGKNQAGMGADIEVEDREGASAWWRESMHSAIMHARKGIEIGLHKQIVNRVLEPFSHITTLVTTTELENFFTLRTDKAAQPEFRHLALKMQEVFKNSTPYVVNWSENVSWIEAAHLPLVSPIDAAVLDSQKLPFRLPFGDITTQQLCFISAARCARVSYLRQLELRPVQDDLALAARLLAQKHMSPFEHVAFASATDCQSGNFRGFIQMRQLLGTASA